MGTTIVAPLLMRPEFPDAPKDDTTNEDDHREAADATDHTALRPGYCSRGSWSLILGSGVGAEGCWSGLGGRWSLRGALKQGSCWFGCSASEGAVEGPGRFRRTRGGLVCG